MTVAARRAHERARQAAADFGTRCEERVHDRPAALSCSSHDSIWVKPRLSIAFSDAAFRMSSCTMSNRQVDAVCPTQEREESFHLHQFRQMFWPGTRTRIPRRRPRRRTIRWDSPQSTWPPVSSTLQCAATNRAERPRSLFEPTNTPLRHVCVSFLISAGERDRARLPRQIDTNAHFHTHPHCV